MTTINASPRISAFLNLIAQCEGTSNNPLTKMAGYDVIAAGQDGPNRFSDLSHHPFSTGRPPIIVSSPRLAVVDPLPSGPKGEPLIIVPALGAILSTASGRYQISLPTWKHLSETYKLVNFSPRSQDSAAVHLLDECDATRFIWKGDIESAIYKASDTWESFPGSIYGKHTLTIKELKSIYNNFLLLAAD